MDLHWFDKHLKIISSKEFDLKKTELLYGKVCNDRIPQTLTLTPDDSLFESITVNRVDTKNDGVYEICALHFDLNEPETLSLNELIAIYGDAEEFPRVSPEQPVNYKFRVIKGNDSDVLLRVGYDAADKKNTQLSLISFVRYGPNSLLSHSLVCKKPPYSYKTRIQVKAYGA